MKKQTRLSKSFVIGRSAALKMSAVEGIYMSSDTKKMFTGFAKDGLTPAQQRAEIAQASKAKA